MKARFNQAPLYLTLTLLATFAGACGVGGDNSSEVNVQPSPQPVGSQPFPKPTVPNTAKSATKVALTRPTNPDDRLRVIKSGRNDPFQELGGSKDAGGTGGNGPSGNNAQSPTPKAAETQYYKKASDSYSKFLDKIASVYTKPGQSGSSSGPSLSTDPSSGSSLGGIALPSLPSKPELANVKVTGVVDVAGVPHAIVQAPGEPTSRTVGIGDSLSGGQLVVSNIDLSNPTEPKVIFQQGNTSFSVAVGREPELIASALPELPLKPLPGKAQKP